MRIIAVVKRIMTENNSLFIRKFKQFLQITNFFGFFSIEVLVFRNTVPKQKIENAFSYEIDLEN